MVLEIEDLTRSFDHRGTEVHALRGVSLTAGAGQIVGLLGLNGAGKSTMLKIVSTLLLPTSGSVRVCGHDVVRDPRRARENLSVVLGGDRGLYQRLSGRDNLRFFATLAGVPSAGLRNRAADALDFVGLTRAADRAVETYSKGMRQRLHLAIGLITRPELLLLDEPTVGLDPLEAQNIRQAVAGMRDEGTTIILTSHYLSDIEQLSDRIVLLQEGRITHDRPLAEFLDQARCVATVTITGTGRPPAPAEDGFARLEVHAAGWTLTRQVDRWHPQALRELADAWPDAHVSDVRVVPSGLEDVFTSIARTAGADA
ncbi:ABC transporter ATP-binding protein [Kitasatospora sp. NPDC048194]|uniref:ABC transporter ATP-binding protein n=1 Tax=Kitasatospora sp. NPDC048194 TaxID=3364045 RepID=UPI003716EF2E